MSVKSILFSGIVFFAASLFAYLFVSSFARRIDSLATTALDISQGDLTRTVPETEDEIGVLARAFNSMVEGLSSTVKKIIDSSAFITGTTDTLLQSGRRLSHGAESQEGEIRATMEATLNLTRSIDRIAGDSEEVEESTTSIAQSVSRMDSSIREMKNNFLTLSDAVTDTASSITQMSASIREVADSAEDLKKISQDSRSSISYLSKSIENIAGGSREAFRISQEAQRSAEAGATSVSQTVESIKEISCSFDDVKENIKLLDSEIVGISGIVKLIADFADRANLLSLNAAIIAAQAGRYGRGFGVVADEIKKLTLSITDSLREIEEKVKSIREKFQKVDGAIGVGESRVQKGVKLSADIDVAFQDILNKLKASATNIGGISELTEKQIQSTSYVTEQTEMVAKMANAISTATSEESETITAIQRSSDNMKMIADKVAEMVSEQARASENISRSMESITKMAITLKQSQEDELRSSRNIEAAMGKLRDVVLLTRENLLEVGKKVEELDKLANNLKKDISKFKVD